MGLWRQHSALHFVFCFGMFPFTVTSECVTGLFSVTAFWSLLHQHSLKSTAIFYSCWFFSCFYFSRYFSALLLACVLVVPTLCAWRFKRNSRKYSGFYLSGCAFCCMLFLTATSCFCCNFVARFLVFFPDTSIITVVYGWWLFIVHDCLFGRLSLV